MEWTLGVAFHDTKKQHEVFVTSGRPQETAGVRQQQTRALYRRSYSARNHTRPGGFDTQSSIVPYFKVLMDYGRRGWICQTSFDYCGCYECGSIAGRSEGAIDQPVTPAVLEWTRPTGC